MRVALCSQAGTGCCKWGMLQGHRARCPLAALAHWWVRLLAGSRAAGQQGGSRGTYMHSCRLCWIRQALHAMPCCRVIG